MSQQAFKAAPVKCGLVPYLTVGGAVEAADFYGRAFGAEIAGQHRLDGKSRTMHVHLYVNGASLMISDVFPEHGHALKEPQGLAMTPIVDDIASAWERAIGAGATPLHPPPTCSGAIDTDS